MQMGDLKVYGLNTITLAITFSEVEDTLKIILLMASIGYTMQRWYLLRNKNE